MTRRINVVETAGPATHKKREDEDTIRHSLNEVGSRANIDVAEAADAMKEAAEQSEKASRSLLLESRRTRMASRPGMKRPFIK